MAWQIRKSSTLGQLVGPPQKTPKQQKYLQHLNPQLRLVTRPLRCLLAATL